MRLSDNESRINSLTGRNVIFFDTIGSTNTFLKENGICLDFPVVCALNQSSGRGRTGKSFYSHGGAFFSVPYKLNGNEKNLSFLTLASGLAVSEALNSLYHIKTLIKWPNDVYFNGKKLCGILCETVWGKNAFCTVGIGINTDITDFPPGLTDIATSLLLNGVKSDLCELISECILKLDGLVYGLKITEKENDTVLNEIKKRSFTLNKNVVSVCGSGTAVDILNDGSLKIQTSDGEFKIISTGEVNIK